MGELSKPEICRLTNVTTPTVSRMIEELIDEGWVIDRGCGNSIGGKRPHVFSLNPDAAYILGVDIGREYLRVAIFNLKNEPIEVFWNIPRFWKSRMMRRLSVTYERRLMRRSGD